MRGVGIGSSSLVFSINDIRRGGPDALPYVDSDLRNTAGRVIEKARELCIANSVTDAVYEVVEGDARTVLCETVEKLHADILVVGSHGYGAIKRAVLGSVSDYCAHHAHCSVMIVKKPKQKHLIKTTRNEAVILRSFIRINRFMRNYRTEIILLCIPTVPYLIVFFP
ncbi:Universal stress protein A-like protein [Apostasia shenzhenica]|uniref:Universal stress protein A-like protein n=1 Tax=Apostasia shenzhenica TaxID=1088818 RepID=A0A2I0A068_9ASPA|nr:Universal stress protein A-like protein [Apostasia shenzhenica]